MLSKLINKPFNCISRAVDMLCLFLGDDYDFFSTDGRTVKVAEFSPHLQTQWRFRKNNTILLASRDIYESYSKDVAEDWEYDIIGRPDCECSIFDVFAKSFSTKMRSLPNAFFPKPMISQFDSLIVLSSSSLHLLLRNVKNGD